MLCGIQSVLWTGYRNIRHLPDAFLLVVASHSQCRSMKLVRAFTATPADSGNLGGAEDDDAVGDNEFHAMLEALRTGWPAISSMAAWSFR